MKSGLNSTPAAAPMKTIKATDVKYSLWMRVKEKNESYAIQSRAYTNKNQFSVIYIWNLSDMCGEVCAAAHVLVMFYYILYTS